jgi:RNA polymerase sigma factor (sigma-70 family)
MPERLNPEAIFLEHLNWIDRVAATACRQHGVWGAAAEDFAAWVRLKIMEDDYALLRNFRGESAVKTYFVTLVTRLFHDYRREQFGRWRPSAAARRLGSPAVELEALVRRDGERLDQAGEKLRTAGRTTMSDRELARLLAQLPEREALRPREVPADAVLDRAEDSARADDRITAAEAEARANEVGATLRGVMSQLEPEDRMIVRMHFQDGYSVAAVARILRLEQKPLYRRIERLRNRVRELLEREGITDSSLRAQLDSEGP